MTRFIIRRILQAIPVLFLITLFSFTLMHSAPGNFINPLEFPGEMGQEQIDALLHTMGLDRPWYVQYGDWLWQLAHLDLGRSFKFRVPVLEMIMERLPATLELTIAALLLALFFGILIGVLSAITRGSAFDTSSRIFAVAGHAVPLFWLGLICIWIFAVELGWLPTGGIKSLDAPAWDLWDRLKHLLLPAVILSFGRVASFSRYVRGELLEVLQEDYVRTARAKGLAPRVVLSRHALRNALIPLITVLGMNVRWLFGGAVLTETIFAWPGMGRLIVNAAFQRDYPVVMGTTLFSAILVIVGNLLADITYAVVDPRIQQE
jgi:peptide/nickel transport system permease protein